MHRSDQEAPELLLREVPRVQRLARAIVHDAETAADVAQDTLLTALQRPPRRAGDAHSLRCWLTKVVRSLAARARRDARVRERHERTAARPCDDRQEQTALRRQRQRELLAAVYLACMENKTDMLQIALVRRVPISQQRVVFELAQDLLPVHSLRGRVVNDRQEPMPRARLVAWRIDGDGLVVHRAGATDAEGAFTIGPLPPGQYEVRIEAQPPPREPPCGLLTAAGDAVLPDLVVPAARR